MTHLHNRTTSRPKRFVAIAAAALMASTAAGTAFAQQTPSPSQPSAAAASDSRDGSTMRRGDGPRMSGQRGERGGKEFRGHGGRGGMQGMGRMGGGGRHAGMMARMFTPARVADALSTIETGIGVRPDQMEAWRTFTAAVVAFADASQPPRMGMGMGQGRGMMMPNAGTDTSDADTAMADDTDTIAMADEETDDTAASDEAMQDDSDDSASTAGQAAPQFRAFRMLDRMADRAIAKAGDAEALKSAIAEVEGVLTPEQITAAHGIVRSMMRDAHAERRMEMRGHGGGRGDMRRGHGHGHGGGSEGGYHHRGGDDGRGPDRR